MNVYCAPQDACPVILDSKCVIYEGENLIYLGINTNDNLRVALQKINTTIQNLVLTGAGITELVGDVIAVGPGVTPATLATVNSTPGQFGSSTAIPKLTVDGKGRITAITTEAVFIPSGALSFIGDVTGTGNTGSNTTLTLATVNSNVYTTNNFLKFSVNGKGLVTAATPVTSSDIISTLGYTPYNATNPANYISRLGLSAISPLDYNSSNGQFGIQQATSLQGGYLSNTDWNTFNNKQAAGNYITNLNGEATASGPGVASVTLSNAAVIAKVLTGLNITGGSVVDTDSLLVAIGKIQNQLNALYGGTQYQGVWNANTNTPTLASGVGTKGHYYIVSVPGTTNLDGITDWNLGDWAIYDGTAWQQVDNTDAVVSVNGQTGAVSLTTDNIPEGTYEYFTTSRARLALSGGTGISYDNVTGVISSTITQYTDAMARTAISLTTVGSSGAATYDNITGVFNIPNYTDALTGYVPYTGATANVDLGTHALLADYLHVSTTSAHSVNVADIVWNPDDGTFDMGLLNGVTLQAGQELHFYGKATGAISNGQAVMFAGSEGDHILITVATQAAINANPEYFIGVATQDFVNNEFGYVTVLGKVRQIDTTIYTGSVLYFDSSGTTPGALTATMPDAPNAKIIVAAVIRVHQNEGILMVRPHTMPKMNDVQDVYSPIASRVNNSALFWNSTNSRYESNTIAGILGYTPANAANVVPYTGATSSVDLGTNDLTSRYIVAAGSGGLGGVVSIKQDATYLAKGNGYSSIASSDVMFDFFGYTGASTYKNFTLRFDGLTDNTRRQYTLPDSDGTLALTSNLSSYLPLSGGTLTGSLYGTYAEFSDKIRLTNIFGAAIEAYSTASALIPLEYKAANHMWYVNGVGQMFFSNNGNLGIGTTDPQYKLDVRGTIGLTGALSGTSATFSGTVTGNTLSFTNGTYTGNIKFGGLDASAYAFDLVYQTNNALRFGVSGGDGPQFQGWGGTAPAFAGQMYFDFGSYTRNIAGRALYFRSMTTGAAPTVLTIAANGAATFSSSVTAGSGVIESGGLNIKGTGGVAKPDMLRLSNASAGAYYWDIWRDNTTGYLNFGAATGSSLSTFLTIKDVSGNVGIGTSSPTNLLHLNKSSGTISMTLQTGSAYGYFYNDGTNIGLASDSGSTGLKFVVSRNAPDNAMTITNTGSFQLPWANDVVNIMKYDDDYKMGLWYRANSRILTLFSTGSDGGGSISFSTKGTSSSGPTDYGIERLRITPTGTVQPGANGTQDLGTSSLRWATVYTSDLDMSNGVGDYTIVEGREDLFLYNNITKKVFKFALVEVDPSEATPKIKK